MLTFPAVFFTSVECLASHRFQNVWLKLEMIIVFIIQGVYIEDINNFDVIPG